MWKIFGHCDRNCHTWLGIDLSCFLKEMFEELRAVPPPHQKKKKTQKNKDGPLLS